MELHITVLCCLITVACVSAFEISNNEYWTEFKQIYKKNYQNEKEEYFRMQIFLENKDKIEKHNLKFSKGIVSYTLGLNKYSDLLYEEFYMLVNGYNSSLSRDIPVNIETLIDEGIDFVNLSNATLPKSINWTELGAVTSVKEQGYCGSCWPSSAVGALEGQIFVHKKILTSLSIQNLMDCSKGYGNSGCSGGFIRQAYRYIKYNDGINSEEDYPYKGVDGITCNFDKTKVSAKTRGYVNLPQGNETVMMEAVANVGPLAVVIDVNREQLQFYKNGVFSDPECRSGEEFGTHAVLCVGYGSDVNGGDYWLLKNSWGSTWGDEGFIKLSRNNNNHCGIANDVSYPMV